jgi:hypothetical protein
MNIELLAWNVLTRVFEKVKHEPFFLTQVFGKNVEMSMTKEIVIRKVKHGGKMANIGLRGDPVNVINSTIDYSEEKKEPPQIYESDLIKDEHLGYNFDVRAFNNATGTEDVMRSFNALYGKKVRTLLLRRKRAIEWMFAQLLAKGKIIVETKDRKFMHDFGTASPTPFNLFDKSVDPLSTIKAACRRYGSLYGQFPDIIITSPEVGDAILEHPTTDKWMNKNMRNAAEYTPRYENPSVTFVGKFPKLNIPEIYAYGATYEGDDGKAKRYIDIEDFAITRTDAFTMNYASQVDYEIDPSGKPIMREFVSKETIPQGGKSKEISYCGYPLPTIEDNTAIMNFLMKLKEAA